MSGPEPSADSEAARKRQQEEELAEARGETKYRVKREQEAQKAKEVQDASARDAELAPLQKALRDEVDFLGKKYNYNSKIGGRGLF